MKPSLEEIHQTIDTTMETRWWKRFVLFIGPAFMVCVGYMDPGNWATDIAGGSKYGYSLLWVLLLSNFIALLLQSLSARLGIVSGRDLAQASRETYPPFINFCLYVLAEIAIAACDLAEVLGMAIGLNLLLGLPLIWGVTVAVLDTFLILFLQQKGVRYMEIFIFSLVAVIGFSFLIELIYAKPDLMDVSSGFIPTAFQPGALYVAIGIIGATVMPHNLYLHSALVQTRRNGKSSKSIWQAIRFNFFDSAIALNLAFFVNISILIVAAAVFHKNGINELENIKDAHALLAPLMGEKLAPVFFAVALIAAGQSSTITGTLAGQIVMEGYLDLRIAPWLRRLITRMLAVVPAFIVIFWSGEKKADDLLILSQVILSMQLGFAVIPLIHFVSDKHRMGEFAIGKLQQGLAWAASALIIFLNLKLVTEAIFSYKTEVNAWVFYYLIFPAFVLSILLLIATFIFPILFKHRKVSTVLPHGKTYHVPEIKPKEPKIMMICIDFSPSDTKAIEAGFSYGNQQTTFYLLHVVESAAARATGEESLDYETLSDWKNLKEYGAKLRQQKYIVIEKIGFGDPKSVIPKMVLETKTDVLVFGSHGHGTLKDLIYGETIQKVRHKVNCQVLIV